ncbi:MAG: outer membrane protein assembly factor BamE [Psittacicella sp.]
MKKLYITFSILLAVFLSGCAYQVKVPQGNILYQSHVNQIKIGMTQEQVEYILGSPVLSSSNEKVFTYVDIKYIHREQRGYIFKVYFNNYGEVVKTQLENDLSSKGFKVITPNQALKASKV